jgi:hypothetical protein
MEKAIIFDLSYYSHVYVMFFLSQRNLEDMKKEATEFLQNLIDKERVDYICYDGEIFTVEELINELEKDYNAGWQPKEIV